MTPQKAKVSQSLSLAWKILLLRFNVVNIKKNTESFFFGHLSYVVEQRVTSGVHPILVVATVSHQAPHVKTLPTA